MNMIHKPLTILSHDYRNAVVALSNDSGLPSFIKAYVLKEICGELETLAQQELDNDIKAYDAMTENKQNDTVVMEDGRQADT